ncbi:amino acid ABC transporter substrate-binding protein [Vibrio sp. JPW-9-11-11]|uniref:substrate-binding periplasmic protein n=1 Tax=Vibrio sp. JPW-9-11-11 TaxID=1416532 RepID=UPI001593A584|nr:transporter substrate-binding domain-containing protein [Vibrio sp. JPW-9-11-11]NVD07134.1 amino acid ABC transporter substrate-binding protein [Vibrio sp. JPW-9-11-11]
MANHIWACTMSYLRKGLIFACCLTALAVNAKVVLMTEEFAPFGFYDSSGKLTGIGVEIVQNLAQRLDVSSEIQVLPWSRAIKELELLPNKALFCVARTPARNDKFDWVGPILSDGVYLFHTEQLDSSHDNLDSAKQWDSIAVTANYPEHQVLLDLGFNNLWITNQPQDNARLLLHNRVSAMVAGEFAMPSLLKDQGHDADRVVRSDILLFDIDLYIAFSKGTDPKVLARWQQALEAFQATSEYQKIRERYTVSD